VLPDDSVSKKEGVLIPPPFREMPFTETGNAWRLWHLFRKDLRYASDRGVWLVWNGHVWSPGDYGGVVRRMQRACVSIRHQAARIKDPEARQEAWLWAERSESRYTIESSVSLARWLPDIEIRQFSSVFDRDPLAVNAANGVVDLRTGELRPHRRNDYLTKILNVAYDPDATCPEFVKFLWRTFPQPGLIDYVQRLFGLCLTGLTSSQLWWMAYGATASGKSTLIKILHGLLGPYAYALPQNYFLASRNGTDFVTGNLPGVRFASAIETNEGKLLDVAKIKMLTGEDIVNGELKYQQHFQFLPQCKLMLATNHRPRIPDTDESIWRRVQVIPFDFQVPERQREERLAERLLQTEGAGILSWAVEGCRQYLSCGLTKPPAIKAAVADYRDAEDIVANFVADRFDKEPGARIGRRETFGLFKSWADENGIRFISQKKLAGEMQRLGFGTRDKTARDRFWAGVRPKKANE
jgi:putative DNA primase/helicase